MQSNKQTYVVAITDDEYGDDLYNMETALLPADAFRRLKAWVAEHQEEMREYYADDPQLLERLGDWSTVMNFLSGRAIEEELGINIECRSEREDFYFESTDTFAEDY